MRSTPACGETQLIGKSEKEVLLMVSPEALKLIEILRNAPKAVKMDLAHQRQAGEHAEDMTSEPQGVTYEEAYSVDGLWATPRSWDGHSAIMYLYGGGYVISSPPSLTAQARRSPRQRLRGPCAPPPIPRRPGAPLPFGRRRRSCRLPVAADRRAPSGAGRNRWRFERRWPDARHDAQAA